MPTRANTILLTGLIAGTLDALAAIILLANMHATAVFQYIASALVGKTSAYQGGTAMVVLGILLHYFIAYSFTLFFFLIYPAVPLLHRSIWISALLYGIFVGVIMNLIVVPLSTIHTFLPLGRLVYNWLILVFTIGLPVSFMAKKYYRS